MCRVSRAVDRAARLARGGAVGMGARAAERGARETARGAREAKVELMERGAREAKVEALDLRSLRNRFPMNTLHILRQGHHRRIHG